jgi:hypothetical protein
MLHLPPGRQEVSWAGSWAPTGPEDIHRQMSVSRLLADAEAPADLRDFLAAFDLMEGVHDLFSAAAFAGHLSVSLAGLAGLSRTSQIARFSPFRCTDFRVWVTCSCVSFDQESRLSTHLDLVVCD